MFMTSAHNIKEYNALNKNPNSNTYYMENVDDFSSNYCFRPLQKTSNVIKRF